MIHEPPLIKPLGDRFLGVEFGDEADLRLNFRVLALAEHLLKAPPHGVLQVVPSTRQLAVVFDPAKTRFDRLRAAIEERLPDLSHPRTLRSRYFRLPVWYDDPWSAATAERYDVPRNIDFVAEQNGLDVAQLIARHTETEYWVTAVGFMPGGHFGYPLEPELALSAPKYTSPRDWTPARTLSIAGLNCATYPLPSPGGYQLLGRLPVDVYQPHPTHPIFPADGVLFRAGDRKRYYAVDPLEYEEIRAAMEDGSYEYDVKTDIFDVESYLAERERRSSDRTAAVA